MVAKVKFRFTAFLILIFLILRLTSTANALEIIRDTELEDFTHSIIDKLLKPYELNFNDLNIFFIKSEQVNAFVTGGKNMFINTEILIEAEDYREYAAVIAHELAHIINGHVFNTSVEISNLSNKAFPIYLLGIIGILAGSTDSGVAGVMVGQASVSDGFSYYSRTQEASADQSAVKILCDSGINGVFLINFLKKLETIDSSSREIGNYKSSHPLIKNRVSWINTALTKDCSFNKDDILEKKFNLIKAKLHGFTHPYTETRDVYSSNNDTDLYATAVSNYFLGDHQKSINNLKTLLAKEPNNPYYNELIGEVYFANHNHFEAYKHQLKAITNIDEANDLYYMMLGNYLLSFEIKEKTNESISHLKKSIQINPNNAYSWYLLARAYALVDEIPLANYATAERYYLIGERELSFKFAMKAHKKVKIESPEWYRTSDLIQILKKEVSIIR